MKQYYERSLSDRDDMYCPECRGLNTEPRDNFISASCVVRQLYGQCYSKPCKEGREVLKKEGVEHLAPEPKKKDPPRTKMTKEQKQKYNEYARVYDKAQRNLKQCQLIDEAVKHITLRQLAGIIGANAEDLANVRKGINLKSNQASKLIRAVRSLQNV